MPTADPMFLLTSIPAADMWQRTPDRRIGQGNMHGITVPLPHACAQYRSAALTRLLSAMQGFGRAQACEAGVPVPGSWCAFAPVFGNPLLLHPSTQLPLEFAFPSLCSKQPHLNSLSAVRAHFHAAAVLPRVRTAAPDVAAQQDRAAHDRAAAAGTFAELLTDTPFSEDLYHLYHSIPAQWRQHAQPPEDYTSQQYSEFLQGAYMRVLSVLSIPPRLPEHDLSTAARQYMAETVGPLALSGSITVRHLTRMLPNAAMAVRWPRHQAYINDAGAPAQYTVINLLDTLGQVWRLPWENEHKEILWRLAVNGLAMPGDVRYGSSAAQHCCCGSQSLICRHHCFWDCDIASAVYDTMCAALPADRPRPQRYHIWLLQPPAGLHAGVWQVVALAALNAINFGRKRLIGMCLAARDQARAAAATAAAAAAAPARADAADAEADADALPPSDADLAHQQEGSSSHQLHSTPLQRLQARVQAEERFWYLLGDFVRLNPLRPAYWSSLHGNITAFHPFLNADARGRLTLAPRPPVQAVPRLPPGDQLV